MPLLSALAQTFQVTEFDILFFGLLLIGTMVSYYFVSLHRVYEAAFGAMVGLGIYILLSVLLVGNPSLGTQGGLFPFGLSAFFVSVSIYLVFILPVLFAVHGGLVINEPTSPILYTLQYIFVTAIFIFVVSASIIYCIDQTYVFRAGNIFQFFSDALYYVEVVKKSAFYAFVIAKQDLIIPLAVVLMLYKLLLANLVSAAVLSVWYNLANVGFYRQKDDGHYRVEFHEVGGHGDSHGASVHGGHDAHTDDHHAPAASSHSHH